MINSIKSYRHLIFILTCLVFSACSNIKYLQEGERLYAKSELKIKGHDNKKHPDLEEKLVSAMQPKPNETIFGLRPSLWFYNIAGTPKKEKGLRNFIKNKLGRPPVLYEEDVPKRITRLLQNRLFTSGHFKGTVTYSTTEKKRRVKVIFKVDAGPLFTIDSIGFQERGYPCDKDLLKVFKENELSPNDAFDVDKLRQERVRISNAMKNNGYYYFNSDAISFQADTTNGDHKVDVYLTTQPRLSRKSVQRYHIQNVFVYANHSLMSDSAIKSLQPVEINGCKYYDQEERYRPDIITKSIFLEPNRVYSLERHDLTLDRLSALKVFKFVNVRFEESDSTGMLNAYIYLTPQKNRSLRLELEAASKSNNFAGPGFSIDFKNRNTFRGAELLQFNFMSNYETQFSSKSEWINSYEFGVENKLIIPRFLMPIKKLRTTRQQVTQTQASSGYHILKRAKYYTYNTSRASFGYNWTSSEKREYQELSITEFNYVKLFNTTDLFDELLDNNPLLKNSFQEQFIIGPTYSYTYSNQKDHPGGNHFYVHGNADYAGTLLGQLSPLWSKDKSRPHTLLGLPFSQYLKMDFDVRYYHQFSGERQLVTRVMAGAGLPYQNSTTLPYAKQYFIGGINSIRAFQARSLGPGTYIPAVSNNLFIDQAGDIKLEANLEYRARIYGIVKGALFVDAGNIWLINEDSSRPGGQFKANQFYNEIAIGTGAGIRVDASFFILRLDLGLPVRIPYRTEGDRWVLNDWSLKKDWRQDNFVWNIAIGYPF